MKFSSYKSTSSNLNHDKTSFEMSTDNSPTLRVSASKLCRKHAISDATFYTWRKKYGGMGCPRLFYEDEIDMPKI